MLCSPNILLDDACTAKIADVGIAKYSVRDLTSLGQAFGSWDWASPEQIMCEECSVRTDLYSLGVVSIPGCFWKQYICCPRHDSHQPQTCHNVTAHQAWCIMQVCVIIHRT